LRAKAPGEKQEISMTVVRMLHQCYDPPGRFMKKQIQTNDDEGDEDEDDREQHQEESWWQVLDRARAAQKVSQAFREWKTWQPQHWKRHAGGSESPFSILFHGVTPLPMKLPTTMLKLKKSRGDKSSSSKQEQTMNHLLCDEQLTLSDHDGNTKSRKDRKATTRGKKRRRVLLGATDPPSPSNQEDEDEDVEESAQDSDEIDECDMNNENEEEEESILEEDEDIEDKEGEDHEYVALSPEEQELHEIMVRMKTGRNRSWLAKFEMLVKYREEHGDCLVKTKHPDLGSWVTYQRTQYRLLQDGKPSRMSEDRLKMLQSIDFVFENVHSMRAALMHQSEDEQDEEEVIIKIPSHFSVAVRTLPSLPKRTRAARPNDWRIFITTSETVLQPEDENTTLTSDYSLYLVRQLQVCRLTNPMSDKDTKFGLQCRHCGHKRFLYSDVDKLARLFFRNVASHVMKCKDCPAEVNDVLESLSQSHASQKKHLPMGCQQIFFNRIWCRVQGRDPNAQGDKDIDDIYGSTEVRMNEDSWNSEDEENLNTLEELIAECTASDDEVDADDEGPLSQEDFSDALGLSQHASSIIGIPEQKRKRKSRRQNQKDITWKQRYDELQVYQEQHGDCLVPHNYPENPDLAKFVDKQRKAYLLLLEGKAYTTMTEERMHMLSDIGFVFELATSKGAAKTNLSSNSSKRRRLNSFDNSEEGPNDEDNHVYDSPPAKSKTLGVVTEKNFVDAMKDLPTAYKDRFGDVCWADGGGKFGWWPAIIFDPTSITGSPRKLARENLGQKHLVYFFECHDAPFMALEEDVEIVGWEEGMVRGYDKERTGKKSKIAKSFNLAVRTALDELSNDKSAEERLQDIMDGDNGSSDDSDGDCLDADVDDEKEESGDLSNNNEGRASRRSRRAIINGDRKSTNVTRSKAGQSSAKHKKSSSFQATSRVLKMDLRRVAKNSNNETTPIKNYRRATNRNNSNLSPPNRAKWSKQEDDLLSKAVMKSMADFGSKNRGLLAHLAAPPDWAGISSQFSKRSLKQCRDRWHNYLNPNNSTQPYNTPHSNEEDELIVKLQQKYGNRWRKIAEHLPGRTDNAVKNRFHTLVRNGKINEPVCRKPKQKDSVPAALIVPKVVWNPLPCNFTNKISKPVARNRSAAVTTKEAKKDDSNSVQTKSAASKKAANAPTQASKPTLSKPQLTPLVVQHRPSYALVPGFPTPPVHVRSVNSKQVKKSVKTRSSNVVRGWSVEEDKQLKSLVEEANSKFYWKNIAPNFQDRTAMECKTRWNSLSASASNKKLSSYTKEEDDKICALQKVHGNKWRLIASQFEGRTENAIKNRFATLKQKLKL